MRDTAHTSSLGNRFLSNSFCRPLWGCLRYHFLNWIPLSPSPAHENRIFLITEKRKNSKVFHSQTRKCQAGSILKNDGGVKSNTFPVTERWHQSFPCNTADGPRGHFPDQVRICGFHFYWAMSDLAPSEEWQNHREMEGENTSKNSAI